MSKYIGCWFGLEEAAEENGEMRIAHSFDAVNDKQAKAKAALLFMEAFPDADDSQFEFRMYAAADGVPCPAEEWDETFLFDHKWDEEAGHPVAPTQIKHVAFDELQEPVRIAILTKYHTTDITHDQLSPAIELLQDDASTFDGHIVEAITKMPAIASMYPERILEAIQYVRVNCPPNKKWPEIKAALSGWLKSHEEERKDGNHQTTSGTDFTPGSGNPDRFDVVVALLVMGKDPSKAGATDVKNAKHIKETRDPAWRGWRTTLVGIPGIYDFPEQLLYELTLDGMKDLSLIENSEGRLAYVREHFGGHPLLPDYFIDEDDNHETEQNTAASTDSLAHESSETTPVAPQHNDDVSTTGAVETAPPVERTGPFYYRTADGQPGRANKLAKLEAVIQQGCIEITKEEYQALKETPPAHQQTNTSDAQPGINNLGDGRFSIEGLTPEKPQTEEKNASNEGEKTEVTVAQTTTTFQAIGAALEHELAEKGDNMKIWRSVMRTDPRYTKDLAGAGFEGTSINAEYMIMRATEIFGPIGTGWGFEVLEDRMLPGAPMSEAIYEDKKFIGNRLLRDGDGTLITEQNHSIKIAFWYLKEDGVAERFEAYGATKYLYKTKNGITCDGEAQKKSLTDAIKKALSLLGFSADVWLGLYDQAEYKQENATEFAIKNASEKAEDVTRLRNELDEKLTRVANTIEHAVSTNEAKKVFDTLAREVEVHRKAAEAKGDTEHAKYLSGRLRRLTQIKDQRIKTLTENQEQSA
ncbi:exodeoxyribonuclease VIII [Enterobacter kobei]|uniref:exodeoxyribonuclease VIII n=1 Tax=Enterobacter kobei TaxID=208224 RepID=UPI002A81EC4B|nr:exodeoxyribonuclease VIII [Enterobacter kobei]